MSAVLQPVEARLEPLTIERLEAVCAVEHTAYSHPWTRANFIDSMAVGYHCQCLLAPVSLPNLATPVTSLGETLIGYYVAMKGVDEVHLLNITVAPAAARHEVLPTAAAMLRLAPALLAAGRTVDAAYAWPLYVRDKVAQTTEERAVIKAAAVAISPVTHP